MEIPKSTSASPMHPIDRKLNTSEAIAKHHTSEESLQSNTHQKQLQSTIHQKTQSGEVPTKKKKQEQTRTQQQKKTQIQRHSGWVLKKKKKQEQTRTQQQKVQVQEHDRKKRWLNTTTIALVTTNKKARKRRKKERRDKNGGTKQLLHTLPWHALDEVGTEMVEGNSDLHVFVEGILRMSAKEHNLVMVSEVVVGDGDGGGAFNDISETVSAVGEVVVIDPDIIGSEDVDAISVCGSSVPDMLRSAAYRGRSRRNAIVNVDPVHDDVGNELDRQASTSCYVYVRAPSVQGLETVHHQLLFQLDQHVLLEDDPQRLVLYGAPPQCPWSWVHDVVVAVVCNDVDLSVLSSYCVSPESDCTICQALSVARPVWVAPPAVVDWVASSTARQHSPGVVCAHAHHTTMQQQQPIIPALHSLVPQEDLSLLLLQRC